MRYEIKGFELLADSGDGTRTDVIGLVKHETDANQWVRLGGGYRRSRPFEKTIIVHESLPSLQEELLNAIRERARAKLTQEEQDALGV